MATCRTVIADALRALRVIAPGDDPTADELVVSLEALQNLVLEQHEGRVPLVQVDVSAATWIPSENQRLRIQAGSSTTVELPNSVPLTARSSDPCDYGFSASSSQSSVYIPHGSTGSADNVAWRQPNDGARIEVVGATHALYFYRDDLNAWMPALGLTLDTELPLNARYSGHMGAILADRLLDSIGPGAPSPALAKRIARAKIALATRTGAERMPTRMQNL